MKKFLHDSLIMVAIAVLIFIGLRSAIETVVIHLPSMLPNFQEGQRLIVNKLAYKFHEPERGDVIIFHPPPPYDRNRVPFIKRIIGLPGEFVEIKEGIVYIHQEDGSVLPLDEPYIKEGFARPFQGHIIPENEYFVLGDNRENSADSRNGWTVPHDNIIGKAWISIWPPDLWGLAANYPFQEQTASATNE